MIDVVRLLAIALLIAGCGDNIGAIPFTEYAVAGREARCAHYVACGVIPGEIDCAWADLGSLEVPQYFRDSIVYGRIRWRPDVAYECLSHADEWSCDRAAPDDWCDESFYEGTLHDGDACQWSGECISRECWDGGTGTCDGVVCPGVCVGDARPVPGRLYEGCRFSSCVEGWCDNNICQPFVPDCGPCERDSQCELGSSCSSGALPRVCTRLPDTGESCIDRCRQVGDTCPYSTNRCQPFKRPYEACITSDECSPFYVCDRTLTCRPRLP